MNTPASGAGVPADHLLCLDQAAAVTAGILTTLNGVHRSGLMGRMPARRMTTKGVEQ